MLNAVAREGLEEMAMPEQRLGKGEGAGSEDRVQQVQNPEAEPPGGSER